MDRNYIYHHGIKGQRWGVRRTPAQLGHKVNKRKKAKAAEKAKKKEMTLEEKKSAVLNSRSAKSLYENRKLFNFEEMNRAHKLLELDKKVKDMIVHEPNKVEKFVDNKIIPWANRVKNFIEPVGATLKKIDDISKLFGDDESNKTKTKNNNGNNGNNGNNNGNNGNGGNNGNNNGNNGNGGNGGNSGNSKSNNGNSNTGNSKSNSGSASSIVNNYSKTSVAALPSPSQAPTFIAGLLEAPKE